MSWSICRHANTLNTKAKDFPTVVAEAGGIKQRIENILNDPKSHFINFENVWHPEISRPVEEADLNSVTGQDMYSDTPFSLVFRPRLFLLKSVIFGGSNFYKE